MPKYTEYLMLNPNDPTEVLGEVSRKKVQKDLNISSSKFYHLLNSGKLYKGCILVEKYDDEPREEEQFDQLILENQSGKKYYATSDCRIYVVYKNGKKKYLSIYQKKGRRNQCFVKLGDKEKNAVRIFAIKFLGMRFDQVCILEGDLRLENIKIFNKHDFATITGKMSKSIPVGLFDSDHKVREWQSARDAAKDLYISKQTVCDYCNGRIKKPMYDLRWIS